MNINRRTFIGGTLAIGTAAGLSGCVPLDQSPLGRLAARLRLIEANAGGTLGAEILNTVSGASFGLNRDMRFGHCSSFKTSLAALVLAGNAEGSLDASRRVNWAEADLLSYAPFARERIGEGATLLELAEATQKLSDNTAANILLREVGGPEALTAFWRAIGDTVSRLDRIEPALNNVPATEIRDTSTPSAMARTMAKLAYGDALPESERATLRQWMIDTATGARRVRAGLPQAWRSGDKTGTSLWPGMGSLYVDIGFVEAPSRAPITFAAYFRTRERTNNIAPAAEAVLAQVGRVLTDFVR